jgi:hypothetical protein
MSSCSGYDGGESYTWARFGIGDGEGCYCSSEMRFRGKFTLDWAGNFLGRIKVLWNSIYCFSSCFSHVVVRKRLRALKHGQVNLNLVLQLMVSSSCYTSNLRCLSVYSLSNSINSSVISSNLVNNSCLWTFLGQRESLSATIPGICSFLNCCIETFTSCHCEVIEGSVYFRDWFWALSNWFCSHQHPLAKKCTLKFRQGVFEGILTLFLTTIKDRLKSDEYPAGDMSDDSKSGIVSYRCWIKISLITCDEKLQKWK